MTHKEIYPYATGDLLEKPNSYFYSIYHGEPLLEAWQVRRRESSVVSTQAHPDILPTATETDRLIKELEEGLEKSSAEASATLMRLDRLVQRFEVTKRIFDAYTDEWRAVDRTRYYTAASYARFSAVLCMAFEKTGYLIYLNALLKCNDILNAIDLPSSVHAYLPSLFSKERAFIETLRANLPIAAALSEPAQKPKDKIGNKANSAPQVLKGFIMIACASARSQAYIQAMLAKGLVPEEVIFLGADKKRSHSGGPQASTWCGLTLPNLSESFTSTCAKARIRVRTTEAVDVNSDEVMQALSESDAHIVIYSGIGGQIVEKRILEAGPRFLHMHAGWLPDYRGSTTVYYSLLNGEPPGVSAIFLDASIDTGPILKRQKYPTPPSWMDVDLVYDGAIRADLLCQVMAQHQEQGKLVSKAVQDPDIGRTYFVIHPVLKHIALLSTGARPNSV
ncbi:formyltransferase family protein [bacterium]|nr:formyltransferase family protein [bacterium]